jgi:hypothetical protein
MLLMVMASLTPYLVGLSRRRRGHGAQHNSRVPKGRVHSPGHWADSQDSVAMCRPHSLPRSLPSDHLPWPRPAVQLWVPVGVEKLEWIAGDGVSDGLQMHLGKW